MNRAGMLGRAGAGGVFWALLCLGPFALHAQQPADIDRTLTEPGWVEQLLPGALNGWRIQGGRSFDKGVVVLGDFAPASARLLAPLSEDFDLYLEYRMTGPTAAQIRFYRHGLFSGGVISRNLSIGGSEPVQMLISGRRENGHQSLVSRERYAKGETSSTNSGAPIDSIELVVPAGQTLRVARVSLRSTATASPVDHPLYVALGVLTALLLGIMALGWFLNRRRPGSASTPRAAP